MSSEEQDYALAGLDGWTLVEWNQLNNDPPSKLREDKVAFRHTNDHYCGWLPRYREDRNALQRLILQLDDEQWLEFMLHVCDLTGTQVEAGKWTVGRALMSAPTPMLAEAVLRATGVWWVDEEKEGA